MKAWTLVVLLSVVAGGARGQVIVGGGDMATPAQQNPQQNSQQNNDPPGSMSGRVVNAVTGEPVRGAMVGLQNYSRGGNYQSATTDSAGSFTLGSVPPGDYVVQVNHPNYQGIMGLPNPSQLVTVASGGESSGVTLRLMPGGAISGKVLDDGGEPVPGCPVYALGPGQSGGSAEYGFRANATTNDKGEYKFDALTADRYILHVRCQESLPVERPLAVWRPEQIQPAESWQPLYYPDNSSPEGAQWLTVLPGRVLTGIDFRLNSTPVTTVSGTISGALLGAPGTQPNIQLTSADSSVDSSLAYGASFDAANSSFQIQMVPPGSYRLVVISSPPQMESLAYATVPVNVGKARPAPLVVQMHPGLTVTGGVEQPPAVGGGGGNVVRMNSLQSSGQQTPKAPALGSLSLMPLSQTLFSSMRQVEVRHDGTFTVLGLTPGRYKVVPQIWSPQPVSMESVQFGASQASRAVIDLTEGSSGALRVRMGSSAQVSASLADAPAPSGGQWMVFALSVDETVGPMNQLMTGTGKSGDTVRMQNVSVGKFSFVAVDMTMNGGIQNERLSHLLRERVEAVEIVAGQDQTVSPKFFTTQEIEGLAMAYLRGETR